MATWVWAFDMPAGTASADGGDPGECGCGNNDWSYVWIANSGESTVSKIDTRTMVEEGRYLTRADAAGNPSRTSVSVDGKAVAVANRHTGIVKIWTRPEFCSDRNGTSGIQTSSGGTDVLPWDEDDCVAWYADFSDKTVQRPVQWTPGSGPCHTDQKIWTTTGDLGARPGTCGDSGVWVHRLDGETGMVEDTIHLEESRFRCNFIDVAAEGLGPYGGALDYEGNFWFHGFGTSQLARVDFDTLEVEIFDGGGYGITVDTKARVWLSGNISRFDYAIDQRRDRARSAMADLGGGRLQWFGLGRHGNTRRRWHRHTNRRPDQRRQRRRRWLHLGSAARQWRWWSGPQDRPEHVCHHDVYRAQPAVKPILT